jgi:integrase/recombinase XerD
MTTLRQAVNEYIAQRREQGFKMRTQNYTLLRFVHFMEENDIACITTDATTRWLKIQSATATAHTVAGYMDTIREFSRFRMSEDPRTEIPPFGLFSHPPRYVESAPAKERTLEVKAESKPSAFRQAVIDYLAMRRSLGFKLRLAGAGLLDFASFLDERGVDYVTISLALRWAQQPASGQPATWAQRLGFIRDFARYRIAEDPRTQIPLWQHLPHSKTRTNPYLYSEEEIRHLLEAALNLQIYNCPGILKRQTYHCLFGLLAVSGMRISEAVGLKVQDVDLDAGILTIEKSKFGQSRLIPVHPSTQKVLAEFKLFRDEFLNNYGRSSEYFFCTLTGHALDTANARLIFYALSRTIGLRVGKVNRGPRIHDLRHSFAVQTLLNWYRAGEDVERKLPLLSTYLGHVKVKDTYWYLTACPELMGLAVKLLEKRWEENI